MKTHRTLGQKDRSQRNSDALIELGATIKALFHGTVRLIKSLLALLGRMEKVSDYTTLSRGTGIVQQCLQRLIISVTGLQ